MIYLIHIYDKYSIIGRIVGQLLMDAGIKTFRNLLADFSIYLCSKHTTVRMKKTNGCQDFLYAWVS